MGEEHGCDTEINEANLYCNLILPLILCALLKGVGRQTKMGPESHHSGTSLGIFVEPTY